MRKLSFIEKVFSLVNVFPNKKQLTVFGMSWRWDKKHPFAAFPIQRNKVVFWTFNDNFTCNPKYIALKLLELGSKPELVWVSRQGFSVSPELKGKMRFVFDEKEGLKELSTAKVIVVNERMHWWISRKFFKREGQYLINTWHGSLGIKKTGSDRGDLTEEDLDNLENDASYIDYITSNGDYSSDLYKRIFNNHGQVIETGLARNDIFFKENQGKVRKSLNLPEYSKIVLYAPTWRDDGRLDCFDINPDLVVNALEKKFGGEWYFLSRSHPKIQQELQLPGIDVTAYPDIQELMAESDALITDYSSCIYDFILSGRPGFIYATDRKEYEESRGLYYPLDETPFPVSENISDLLTSIFGFNEKEYKNKVEVFLKGKGCREDGHASERIALLINDLIGSRVKDISSYGKASRFPVLEVE